MNYQNNSNTRRSSARDDFQSIGRSQRADNLQSLGRLVEMNAPELTRRPPQPQPEPLTFTGELNAWYKTTRNGQTTQIYLIEIRKDVALYKDQPTDKHSQSISLAKFLKFYKAV
ncbi:hypothetical protein D9M68_19360 [compost metagenome]